MLANSMLVSFVFLFVTFAPLLWLVAKWKSKLNSVVLVGLLVALLAIWFFEPVPSFVLREWCEHELKMYPCLSHM
jgi:hypothetical protein